MSTNNEHGAGTYGDLVEALFLSFLGHGGVHIGPLVVLTLSSSLQILRGAADASQKFKPDLSMLLLVGGSLLKDLRDLHIAILLGFGGKIGVLVAGLGLPSKSGPQIGFSLASLQFRHLYVPHFPFI